MDFERAPRVGLGESNRFFRINPDNVSYSRPVKKVLKFKKHLSVAEDVSFLPNGNIVVCDKDRTSVKIFNEGGKFSKTLIRGVKPLGIATSQSGMVAVVDGGRGKEKFIKVYSSENADLFSKWGEDIVWKPRGITFSNKGHLIITDTRKKQHSVGIYSLDGRQLHRFGTQGVLASNFSNPYYVTVDMFDRIIVSDKDNHAIKVFDERGKFLGMFGGFGTAPGKLTHPRGICTDARGNIVVCDTGNKRVSVFSVDGRHIQDLLTGTRDALGYPFGISYEKSSRKLAVSQHSSSGTGHLRKIRIYELDNLPPLDLVRESY